MSAQSPRNSMAIASLPSTNPNTAAIPTALGSPLELSPWNQHTYERIKLSLELDLRRQVFVVVCDDLVVRAHVSNRLIRDRATLSSAGQVVSPVMAIALDPEAPHLHGPLTRAFCHPQSLPNSLAGRGTMTGDPLLGQDPVVQLFGIEQLTRQCARLQQQFLNELNGLPQHPLPNAGALLLWIPRPWLHSIRQSAPAFWEWHTGLFEFEGDPRPLEAAVSSAAAGTAAFQPTLRSVEPLEPLMGKGAAPTLNLLAADQLASHGDRDQDLDPEGRPMARVLLAGEDAGNLGENSAINGINNLGNLGMHQGRAKEMPTSGDCDRAAAFSTPSSSVAPLPNALDAWLILVQSAQGAPNDARLMARAIEMGTHLLTDYVPTAPERLQMYETLGRCHRARALAQGQDQRQGGAPPSLRRMMQRDLQESCHYVRQGLDQIDQSLTLPTVERRGAHTLTLLKTRSQLLRLLGDSHQDLIRYGIAPGDRDAIAHSQRAMVRAYRGAIASRWTQLRRQGVSPMAERDAQWLVQTYNRLGMIYWSQANAIATAPSKSGMRGIAGQKFRQAIHLYRRGIARYRTAPGADANAVDPQHLSVQSPTLTPDYHYGTLQTNLGTAYLTLHRGDRDPQWLDEAVAAYHAALTQRDMHQHPAAHAATCNNLGIAYRALARLAQRQDPHAEWTYCQQAIAAYEQALAIVGKVPVAFDRAITARQLAQLHQYLAQHPLTTIGGVAQNPDKNLNHHLNAAIRAYSHGLQWLPSTANGQPLLNGLIATAKTILQGGNGLSPQTLLAQVPAQWLPLVLKQL